MAGSRGRDQVDAISAAVIADICGHRDLQRTRAAIKRANGGNPCESDEDPGAYESARGFSDICGHAAERAAEPWSASTDGHFGHLRTLPLMRVTARRGIYLPLKLLILLVSLWDLAAPARAPRRLRTFADTVCGLV
jgi:hypothetical protein